MKWILWSDRLPEPAQDTRFVHTRKAFLLPRVPEVFLACSKNFCCWPKADTSLAEAMRKNLWHELLLFTVPIDLWPFYQITSLAPMVLFLRPCNRSFIAQCCLVNFAFFMDLDKLELTWSIRSQQSCLLRAQSIKSTIIVSATPSLSYQCLK